MSRSHTVGEPSGSREREPRRGATSGLQSNGVRSLALALCLALCLLWLSSEAQAATTHRFLSSLSEGPAGTALSEPVAVAVDHATGQVFVGDRGTGVVDVYSSTGTFQTQFGEEIEVAGIAVDEATGDVYVADSFRDAVLAYRPQASTYALLAEWSGAATPGKAFGEVTGVAFDNADEGGSDPAAGDLYVLESEAISEGSGTGAGAIDLFKPQPNPAGSEEGEGQEGSFQGRLPESPKLEEPNAIAVDSSSGELFVADTAKGFIATYSDKGAFSEKLTGKGQPFGSFKGKEEEEENILGVAIEESSGDIYVAEAEHHAISQYDAEGQWLGWTTTAKEAEPLEEPRGLALSSSGELYGADSLAELVDRFGQGVVVPDVITAKASKLTRTSAILAGTIDGDGKAAKYSFQWGTTEALGESTSPQSAGSGEEKVQSTLEGLQAGATYFFRIVGENENGLNYGVIHELQTPAAVEGLSTGAITELKSTSVTLTGSFNPGGIDTHYFFQWGSSTAYGNSTPLTDAGSSSTTFEAKAALSALSPNSTYHYRIVAENKFGSTNGADRSFTTSGPPRITAEAPTGLEHEAAKLHAKVNPDELPTRYHFEYGTTTAYGTEVPLGGASLGEGSSPVAVEASLSTLQIGTVYHYRVVAENSDETTFGPDESFETIPPAPIEQTFASAVSASEATLGAQINPLGNETTYFFQYGTRSCKQDPSACTNVPIPPGKVGAGTSEVEETEHLTGLSQATTYFYRVIDENVLGTTEGREHSFRTEAGEAPFALADDRAWEMVSPPDKHGAPIEALTREGGVIVAAEDGDSITYVANGPVTEEPEGNRSPEQQQMISTRGSDEWTSQDIATPNSSAAHGVTIGVAPEYQFFTPDLSVALVEPFSPRPLSEPPLSPEAVQSTIYLRDDASGTYLPLVTEANVAPGVVFGSKVHFVSATADLSHVILKSAVALEGAGSGPGLYEWSAGKLQFVSLLPDGLPSTHEAELGYYHVAANAISDNGSRVIWTALEENAHRGHLYMRDTATQETIQLDAAQGVGEPSGVGTAQFQTASQDGSRVFFTDKQKLTPDSTAEPAQGVGKPDLYECEIVEQAGKPSCDLSDLTVDHAEGEHASVQNFMFGSGDDGTSVYLVAQGALAGNQNGAGQRAEPGGDNLYALHFSGQIWTTTFVATLSGEDKAEWEGELHGNSAYLTARVSPNGRYLAFMSSASATGYDNVDRNSGKPDEEVFLYDAEAASLACVSCNPTGARPAGVPDIEESGEGIGLLVDRRRVWVGHGLAGSVPGWTAQSISSALFQSRYLSDSGRLFFDSPDDLVPQATNGKEDVYEYEPTGTGSCVSSTGGCISLISGGASAKESAFMEATPSGSDVFFLTDAALLPQDTDTAFDLYDARVCTEASPCQVSPTPAPPGCGNTSACRPAEPAQQAPGGPSGTATFTGPASSIAVPPKQEDKGTKKATHAKPLTRAQKLAKAISACRRRFSRSKERGRKACEAHARRLFGRKAKHKTTTRKKMTGGPMSKHTTARKGR